MCTGTSVIKFCDGKCGMSSKSCEQCSVGQYVQEECHKLTFSRSSKTELCTNEKLLNLLQRRLNAKDHQFSTVCTYHQKRYLDDTVFKTLYGAKCCNPFGRHKKKLPAGSSLRTISIDLADCNVKEDLVPGKSVCSTCYIDLTKPKPRGNRPIVPSSTDDIIDENEILEDKGDADYVPPDGRKEALDSVLCSLDVPIPSVNGLNNEKKRKVIESLANNVRDNFVQKYSLEHDIQTVDKEESEYDVLLGKLKQKLSTCNDSKEKIQILSLMAPSSWTIPRTAIEFGVSEYLVKTARNLTKKYGILPIYSDKISRGALSQEIAKQIQDFYMRADVSSECPGMNDCVSVRTDDETDDGKKTKVQKRLVLQNLRETYALYKEENQNQKIGFSTFCSLRPKWCILAGAAGTHSVCVCLEHQNVKLAASAIRETQNYKAFLEALVCDVRNENCMVNDSAGRQRCDKCPGKEAAKALLSENFFEEFREIRYKQWTKDQNNRFTLTDIVQNNDEFAETFLEKLNALKRHHYIAKAQSSYCKTLKENLTPEECLVLCDFAENFTFVVQDEIQSYHWNNQQATLFTVVIYFREADGKIDHKNLVIISDHNVHNTVTVSAFQKQVVSFIKSELPNVKKVFYFTDGAGGQFKNRIL